MQNRNSIYKLQLTLYYQQLALANSGSDKGPDPIDPFRYYQAPVGQVGARGSVGGYN